VPGVLQCAPDTVEWNGYKGFAVFATRALDKECFEQFIHPAISSRCEHSINALRALFVYFLLRSKFTAVHEMRLLGAIFKYHDATGRQVVWDSGSS
jgi:hypothetical protein